MSTYTINQRDGVATWGPLAASVNGETLKVGRKGLVLASAAVTGTFGGTVTLQGSLDGTNWFTLDDTEGNPATFTSAGMVELSTAVPYFRPITGAGVAAATIRLAFGDA
jgi:hypothetical protein